MEQKSGWGKIILAVILTAVIAGGGVYLWQKNLREKGLRQAAENISKDFSSQIANLQNQITELLKREAETKNEEPNANTPANQEPGTQNESAPPDPYANWETYSNDQYGFKIKYPAKYKTVKDNYGWPHVIIHFIEKSGAQSYRAQIEVWDSKDGFKNTYAKNPPFITQAGSKYITVNYWTAAGDDGTKKEWENIISTFEVIPK